MDCHWSDLTADGFRRMMSNGIGNEGLEPQTKMSSYDDMTMQGPSDDIFTDVEEPLLDLLYRDDGEWQLEVPASNFPPLTEHGAEKIHVPPGINEKPEYRSYCPPPEGCEDFTDFTDFIRRNRRKGEAYYQLPQPSKSSFGDFFNLHRFWLSFRSFLCGQNRQERQTRQASNNAFSAPEEHRALRKKLGRGLTKLRRLFGL